MDFNRPPSAKPVIPIVPRLRSVRRSRVIRDFRCFFRELNDAFWPDTVALANGDRVRNPGSQNLMIIVENDEQEIDDDGEEVAEGNQHLGDGDGDENLVENNENVEEVVEEMNDYEEHDNIEEIDENVDVIREENNYNIEDEIPEEYNHYTRDGEVRSNEMDYEKEDEDYIFRQYYRSNQNGNFAYEEDTYGNEFDIDQNNGHNNQMERNDEFDDQSDDDQVIEEQIEIDHEENANHQSDVYGQMGYNFHLNTEDDSDIEEYLEFENSEYDFTKNHRVQVGEDFVHKDNTSSLNVYFSPSTERLMYNNVV